MSAARIDAEVLEARLRVASARLRLMTAEVDELGILLASKRISPAGALELMRQGDLLVLCLKDDELAEMASDALDAETRAR